MSSLRSFLKRLPSREKRITLATYITFFRFLLIPLIVVSMCMHHWGFAFWFFILASVSDMADGFIARNFNQRTFIGACLDPIADKLLTVSIFLTLAFVQSPLFSIPKWFVVIVLIKELLLILGSVLIITIKGRVEINPTYLGKATMFFQVFFITWLFACYFFKWLPLKTYNFALGGLLILIIFALIDYARIGLQQAKKFGYMSL